MSLIKETRNVKAVMIIEVIGRPAEHLTETLKNMIKQIDEEKGVSVKEKKINEPTVLKDNEQFFMNFAEVEVEVEEMMYLLMLMFKYMPAHVDVISPETISIPNTDWSDILNETTRRLHGYDEIARVVQVEKDILEKKLRNILSKQSESKIKEQKEEEKK